MGAGELGIRADVADHHAGLFATRRERSRIGLLAKSALIAVPGCLVVSWLYGFWSSKRTLVLVRHRHRRLCSPVSQPSKVALITTNVLFSVLTVMLLVGLSGMISMLPPYSVELYPTKLRATGGGLTASSSKFGGVLGPRAVAVIFHCVSRVRRAGLSLAVPLLIAAVALWMNGRETSGRRLEEIHAVPVPAAELAEQSGA